MLLSSVLQALKHASPSAARQYCSAAQLQLLTQLDTRAGSADSWHPRSGHSHSRPAAALDATSNPSPASCSAAHLPSTFSPSSHTRIPHTFQPHPVPSSLGHILPLHTSTAMTPLGAPLVRAFAKKASGGGGGGGGSAPAVKKARTSATRLFSCRNDRFRSAFEQIWPTLRLTEEEAALFKKNSRLFVIETGKAISLKAKFDLSRPTLFSDDQVKPHYADARVALFESHLHLDAIGEQPRYMKIRRMRNQFGIRLQNVRKLRLLLGFVRRGYLQRLYEHVQVQAGSNKVWKVVCALESRLSMFALRAGMAPDIIEARSLIRKMVHLNGTAPALKDGHMVQLGDVLDPSPKYRTAMQDQVAVGMSSLLYDVHRDNLQ